MPNMDLQTFYKHALDWKHQNEMAEQLQAEQMAEAIKAQWKRIAELIREALPIKGMTLHETERGMFSDFPKPGRLIDIDCCFDPAMQDEQAMSDGELLRGIIRVRVLWDKEEEDQHWKILKYMVMVDGRSVEFENAYFAFLAIAPSLNISTDTTEQAS